MIRTLVIGSSGFGLSNMRSLLVFPLLVFLAACGVSPMQSSPAAEKDPMAAAERLEKTGNLAGAAVLYRQAISQPDAPIEAYEKLAYLYRQQGRAAEAVPVLREALAREPGNTKILSQLGYALITTGHSQEAVSVFDELSAIEPENAMHYNGKAVAFDNAGNHVAAQEIYQKALSMAPDSANIQNNYAMSLILDKKYDEAIALLEPLVQKNDNPTMRQNLALAYGLKGDSTKAFDLNRRSLSPKQAQDNLRFYQEYQEYQELQDR